MPGMIGKEEKLMVEPTNIEPTDTKPTDVKPTDVKPTDIKPTDIGPPQSEGINKSWEFRCPKCGGHLSEIPSSRPLLDGFLGRNIRAKCDVCGFEAGLTRPRKPRTAVDQSTDKAVMAGGRLAPVYMVFAVVGGVLLGLLIVGLVVGYIPSPFAGGGSYDDTYNEVCVWQIPGDQQRTASYTLTVVNGKVTGNPTGTVASDGTFTGAFVFGAGIPDLPITGTFSKTSQFTLSGRTGLTTWEASVRKQ